MTSFQKRVYRSFALNFLTSDNEVVLFHSVSHLIYSIYQEFIWLNLWSTLVKVLMINKLFLKKKEFAKIFSRSRMKVRHKDYFIYSHGSWRIFHASGSCWPDFFSELAIALIIPYILYNDNVMLRTVKIWLISEATNGEHVLASDQWYAYMNLPVTSILSYPFCTVVIISMYRTWTVKIYVHYWYGTQLPK